MKSELIREVVIYQNTKKKIVDGRNVNSVFFYTEQLKQLNKEFKPSIESMEPFYTSYNLENPNSKDAKRNMNLLENMTGNKWNESVVVFNETKEENVDAAFVSFKSLLATNAVLQINHHEGPCLL